MSVVGNNRVGIPIVLLHDAEGSVVSVETKNGELIRGLLFEAEDMMNLYLKKAVVLNPQGVKRSVDQVYVRGSEIVFISLPDMLRHAPMFQRIKHWRKHGGAPPEGAAVGQAAAILRKATERRKGGFAGGRGGFGRGGGRGGGGGFGGGGRGGDGFGRGGGGGGGFGAPGQYGPR
uniref:Small nuclear ribonucleoprotein Sm D3 n=1 Tax=Ditylum brightwellii TaxID=49249 RepID=A0A7S4VE27_9STRA